MSKEGAPALTAHQRQINNAIVFCEGKNWRSLAAVRKVERIRTRQEEGRLGFYEFRVTETLIRPCPVYWEHGEIGLSVTKREDGGPNV